MEVTVVARVGWSICFAPKSAVFPHIRCGWIGPMDNLADHNYEHHRGTTRICWSNSDAKRAAIAIFPTVVHFPDEDGVVRPWRMSAEERRLVKGEKMTLEEARVYLAKRAHGDPARTVW